MLTLLQCTCPVTCVRMSPYGPNLARVDRLQMGVASVTEMPAASTHSTIAGYAGVWRRLAASMLDLAVVLSFVIPSTIVLMWLMDAFHGDMRMKLFHARYLAGIGAVACWVIGDWYYNCKMIASERQATFGKIWMGIRVASLDNSPVSFEQASTRHFSKFLSTFLLFVGFILAAFTKRRQALHDIIAGTIVVDNE